jgi:CRISPR system Cascade subunit CasE
MHPVFLSRVEFDPRHRDAARLLSNPQFMHGFVNDAVGIAREGAPRWLYYVQHTPRESVLTLQAPVQPTWPEWMDEDVAPSAQTKEITKHLEGITTGREYRFALAAAPRRRDSASKREYPVPEEDRIPWLRDRLGPAAELGPVRVERTMDVIARSGDSDRMRAINRMVEYSGALKVTSPTLFQALLINGIGPGKAYGHGMLRLARIGN